MTASMGKKVKNKPAYVENLLDSDNPIMSPLEDNQEQPANDINRSAIKALRRCYESEIGSEGEEEEGSRRPSTDRPTSV